MQSIASSTHFRESFNSLRNNIMFVSSGKAKCIAVTSSTTNDGKTTVTTCLAKSFASAYEKVLLIDADMRNPSVHQSFSMKNIDGLSSVLEDKRNAVNIYKLENLPSLYVLPAGSRPKDPSKVLSSIEMDRFLKQMRNTFDFVLIDTPPVLPVPDTAALARIVDGTVVVARHGITSESLLLRTKKTLELANVNVLGVVLNDMPVDTLHSYGSPQRHRKRLF